MKPPHLTPLLLTAMLVMCSLNSALGQLSTGLLNYWNFEGNLNDTAGSIPGASSTVADTGTNNGMTLNAGGPLGGYVTGNGTNRNISVPNSADIVRPSQTLTISAWFRVPSFTNSWQCLISHGEGNDYRIARRGGDQVMAYAGGTGDIPGSTLGPVVSNNAWHHIVAISEQGVSARLWVDNSLIATGGAPTLTNNGSSVMMIGANANDAPNRCWNGDIDDVGMWNRRLTAAEIGTIYTAGLAGTSLGTLLTPEPNITILSATPSTVGNDFKTTVVLQDGSAAGRQVVPGTITGVTFDGAAAASFTASKTLNRTTIVAQLTSPYMPGQHVYSVHVIGTDAGSAAYDLSKNVTGPILPPVASLAAPFSATSALPWGIREYSTTAGDGGAAVGIILGNVAPFTDHETAVVNFVDPDAPGDGGDFNNNVPFPANVAGADENHVIVAKARVTLAAAGSYSLNLRTDDGCALKIQGATCTAAFGAALDPADSSMVLNPGVTSARVTYSFPAAGTYDIGFMSFDSGGGGSAEISAAQGSVTSVDERQLPWELLGNTAHPSVLPTTSQWLTNLPGVAGTNGNWGIRTYPTEGYENVENLAAAMRFLGRPDVVSWTQSSARVTNIAAGWTINGYTALTTDSLTTPNLPLPPGAGSATLSFRHRYNFEDDGTQWDGGAIQYSINGGAFLDLPEGAFTQNGYSGTVDGTGPLMGLPGFTGYSNGMITSVATIPGLAPGDEVAILFLGTWDESFRDLAPNWEIASVRLNWGAATVFASDFSSNDGGFTPAGAGADSWVYSNTASTSTRTGVVDTLAPELNFADPQTNSGPLGVVLNTMPFPADTPADDNHVVTVAHTRITVATSAEYTFNNRGDDGFLLRVRAVTGANPFFRRVSGAGFRTMSAPNEMYFPTGTGDTDTRGIIYLAAGQYDLDYVQWEGGGGFWYQLTVAQGAFLENAGVNGTDTWVPVGHIASNITLSQPTMESQWDVKATQAGVAGLGDVPTAEAALALVSTTSLWNILNFNDPQSGGPGRFPGDVPWPNNTGADDNNWAMKATGYLHIETEGDYLLGFEGDDGGYFEIAGAPPAGFSRIVENNTNAAAIVDSNGGTRNRLSTNVDTGNSRSSAVIHLVPSDYPVATLFYEEGGGAYWEVFGSAMSSTSQSFTRATNFTLLRSDPSYPAGIPTFTPDTISGFGLTAQPVADLSLALVQFSFGTGNSYSISFPSSPGLSYMLEYSTDLKIWYNAGVVYGGPGTSTTFAGNLTELSPPLPANASRVYWRVVGLY